MIPYVEELEPRAQPATHVLNVYLDPWTLSLDRYQSARRALWDVDQYRLHVRLKQVFNPAKATIVVQMEPVYPTTFWDGENAQDGAEPLWFVSMVDWPHYWSTTPSTCQPQRVDFEEGVLHELSEVMGLKETNDPADMMYWQGQPGTAVHGFNLAELAALQHRWSNPSAMPTE